MQNRILVENIPNTYEFPEFVRMAMISFLLFFLPPCFYILKKEKEEDRREREI